MATRAEAGRGPERNRQGAKRLCDVRTLHADINTASEQRRRRAEERAIRTQSATMKRAVNRRSVDVAVVAKSEVLVAMPMG